MSTTPAPKYPSTLVTAMGTAGCGVSERNVAFILPIFGPFFAQPTTRRVLELASGQGVHVKAFAAAYPAVEFQPTECDEYGVNEVNTINPSGVQAGLRPAFILDVLEESSWVNLERDVSERGVFDVVVGANFLHMVPCPEGPQAIFQRLRAVVNPKGATLCVYGPFKTDAGFLTESDANFDAMIAARPGGSRNGLRSIDELERIANEHGWGLSERVETPRGNNVLIFSMKVQ